MRQLDELLRDCARAFHVRTRLEVVERGAADADEIETRMRIEARVLGGQKGVGHMLRKLRRVDGDAVFVQVQARHGPPVAVGDKQGFVRGQNLIEIERVPRVLRHDPNRCGKDRKQEEQRGGNQKTSTAASTVQTVIDSDGSLLAHTGSMRRRREVMRAAAGNGADAAGRSVKKVDNTRRAKTGTGNSRARYMRTRAETIRCTDARREDRDRSARARKTR